MKESHDETSFKLKKQTDTPEKKYGVLAAQLIHATGPEIFDYIFEPIGSAQERLQFIEKLHYLKKNAVSHVHSWWLLKDDERVGFILGYHGDYEQELTFQTIYTVLKIFILKPWIFISMLYRFLVFQKMSLDVPPTMYYIAHFAVLPTYFRQGLGSVMMKNLESYLIQNGFTHVCLDVTADNEPAIGLYKKFGFEIKEILTNERVEKRTILKKRYRMEKKLV